MQRTRERNTRREGLKGRGGPLSPSPFVGVRVLDISPFALTYPYLELKFSLELQYGFKLISFTSEHARGYSFHRHL